MQKRTKHSKCPGVQAYRPTTSVAATEGEKNHSCWWSFKLKFKGKLTQKQLWCAKGTILPRVYFENTQIIVGSECQMFGKSVNVLQCLYRQIFKLKHLRHQARFSKVWFPLKLCIHLGTCSKTRFQRPPLRILWSWITLETWPQLHMPNSWKSSFAPDFRV